jgi:hypothetical protein
MAFLEKVRRSAEWLEHGKTVAEIIIALGGGKAVEAALKEFTAIPQIWITPIWLLVSGALLGLLILVANRRPKNATQALSATGGTQAVASSALSPPKIDIELFFRQTYSGQLQAEVEGNVRTMIQNNPPSERDEFVVKFIARGLINVFYDRVWLTIFRSQVLALMELNKRILRREEIKTYYDEATQRSPKIYADYSFDQWLSYLRTQVFILEHPGHSFEITVRGKDFLKYMIHYGYTADGRFH